MVGFGCDNNMASSIALLEEIMSLQMSCLSSSV